MGATGTHRRNSTMQVNASSASVTDSLTKFIHGISMGQKILIISSVIFLAFIFAIMWFNTHDGNSASTVNVVLGPDAALIQDGSMQSENDGKQVYIWLGSDNSISTGPTSSKPGDKSSVVRNIRDASFESCSLQGECAHGIKI